MEFYYTIKWDHKLEMKWYNKRSNLHQHPKIIIIIKSMEIPRKSSHWSSYCSNSHHKKRKKKILHKSIIHKLKSYTYIVQQYQPNTWTTTTKQTPKTPSIIIPMNQFFPKIKKEKKKKKSKPISPPLPPFLPSL